MTSVTTVVGRVVRGHQVASGVSKNSPYPRGTIEMQTPHLLRHGVDLRGLHPATVNVDISPHRWRLLQPRATVHELAWTDTHPPETFSFADCALVRNGRRYEALVYHPHPETKPGHHQPTTVVELLLPWVEDLAYDDVVTLELDAGQVAVLPSGSDDG